VTDIDVVVIGGGPAGLASAIVCASHGLSTMLVERLAFPIDKACGEGLLPNGLAALGRIGVDAAAIASNARVIAGIRYHTQGGRTAEATFEGRALGVRRADLSGILVAHARALPCLDIMAGEVASVAIDAGGRPVVRVAATTLRPKLVIGADGLHSRARSSTGIAVDRIGVRRWGCRQHFDGEPWTDHVEVHFAQGFEVYVTPVARGVNVAVLWDAGKVRMTAHDSPVASLVAHVPLLSRRLAGRVPNDRARARGPFDVRVPRPWRDGVLLVGDAAGYLDPLTGEGVGIAVEQAVLLADTVIPALQRTARGALVNSAALSHFATSARIHSRPNRDLTRLLLRAARRPAFFEAAVSALASNAPLFRHLLDVNMGRRQLWAIPLSALGWASRAAPGSFSTGASAQEV
jgi:2-polyprenyl-6-methoxyphenol hydroxylase-like FAD-dependent oxidoreductase